MDMNFITNCSKKETGQVRSSANLVCDWGKKEFYLPVRFTVMYAQHGNKCKHLTIRLLPLAGNIFNTDQHFKAGSV
jgi:hypothetical protein